MPRDFAYEERAIDELLDRAVGQLGGFPRPFSPVCSRCRHLFNSGVRTCEAFPRGIPIAIWDGHDGHRTAYPGDNGVRFEEAEVPPDDLPPPARR